MPSYSDSLLLKNVLLGLTFRAHGFPSTLADAGYTDAFVEYSLTTATLKTVSYDLGVVAPERNRSLVLEMKGGTYANLPEQQRFLRQLECYGQLTAEDVVERGGFSVAPGQDPRSHDLDVAVVGMDGAIHHLDPLVQQSTFRPPMLAVIVDPGDLTYQGMTVHHGALRDTMLSALLGPLETRYAIPLKIPFDIAAKAGVGVGTIYRHFPTRSDLIIAVYRHQVEACTEAGPALLASSATPHAALGRWINLFVEFLATKHGLAAVLQSDNAGFDALHAYFLDRLVPVCTQLLAAAAEAGEIRPDIDAYELMLGVGNLCIGAANNPHYDARRLVELLIAGLLRR